MKYSQICQLGACNHRVIALGLLLAASTSACSLLFPTEAGDELAHFDVTAPQRGEQLPDITVYDLDGKAVDLRTLAKDKPVVLQLGSHSCPVFRYRRFDMESLKEDFGDRVQFVTVYTLEAHPKGSASPYRDEEWLSIANRVTGVKIAQTFDLESRRLRVLETQRQTDNQTLLIDGVDNTAWSSLGEAPSPAFVIDRNGGIVLRQVWVEPEEIRRTLQAMLESERL